MNWYLTKLIFEIVSIKQSNKSQFEEQLRLVLAANAKEAVGKITVLVKREEDACISLQQPITWKMVAVTAVYPLSEMIDGAELFSTTVETEYPASFIHTAQLRAKDIFTHSELFTD
jgi:Domain of unknown function (DUF4288)